MQRGNRATGRVLLDQAPLDEAYRLRVGSLLGLIDHLSEEIERFAAIVEDVLSGHPGYTAIQQIPGVGPVLAAIFVAEIGDVARFPGPAQLCAAKRGLVQVMTPALQRGRRSD